MTRTNLKFSIHEVEKAACEQATYLERSFRATNAQINGFLIHNYSQIANSFLSQRELENVVDDIRKWLNLSDITQIAAEDNSARRYNLTGRLANGVSVSVVLSSFKHMAQGSNTTVLVIRAKSCADNLTNLKSTLIMIAQAVSSIGAIPQLQSYISGKISEKLVGVKSHGLISAALWAVHAKSIERMESHLTTSVSAYARKGPISILTNHQKMNLQVAVHYDEYHERTNVLVGIPIIVDPY